MNLDKRTETYPDVYILMRLYCADIETDSSISSFFEYIHDALESVKTNGQNYWNAFQGNTYLLINDDTGRDKAEQYEKYLITRNGKLDEIFKTNGTVCFGKWIETRYTGLHSSSAANFNLRLLFRDLPGQKPNDIAITLDQDDALDDNAVISIVEHMKEDGIVISAYNTIDNGKLDISDPARHNALVSDLVNSNGIVHTAGYYSGFSSIGWTKSYSRAALTKYVNDLEAFLVSRGGHEVFFKEHKSYEDFIDFYTLMFKDTPITGNSHVTHFYKKNTSSITSRPSIEDFRDHRTANLIALIDLCYANEHVGYTDKDGKEHPWNHAFTPLKTDYKIGLIRFVAGKVATIETIISDRYIDGYLKKGDSRYKVFAEKTHKGYFISKIARLALGEKRMNVQDKELFRYSSSRTKESAENFSNLFSAAIVNLTPEYQTIPIHSSPRFALRKTVIFEKQLSGNKDVEDNTIETLIAQSTPPHEKQYRDLKKVRDGFLIILLIPLFFLLLTLLKRLGIYVPEKGLWLETIRNFVVEITGRYGNAVAAIVGLGGAVMTFILAEISRIKLLAENEASLIKLYYYEFADLIRHLEANTKVMIQIRKEISKGTHRVQDIHFENLKWPESSCLFSDEMAKIIEKTRVDDFSRLKVNLRNINNSAEWLKNKSENGEITPELIDWEITRYIGYLLNLYYMKEHEFSFPNPEQLDLYIHESILVNKLTQLFMDYSADERELKVKNYMNRYLDDRRMKRAVLV